MNGREEALLVKLGLMPSPFPKGLEEWFLANYKFKNPRALIADEIQDLINRCNIDGARRVPCFGCPGEMTLYMVEKKKRDWRLWYRCDCGGKHVYDIMVREAFAATRQTTIFIDDGKPRGEDDIFRIGEDDIFRMEVTFGD